jgi:hypothetical protein
MEKRSMFVGMDVHKESIDVSLAEEGRDGEVRHDGGIAGDLEALAKVVNALRAPTRRLRFVYEAGPLERGQLRDEPQSGRYPTRGYQQRQPSLERGVADQTDLKNEEHEKSVLR